MKYWLKLLLISMGIIFLTACAPDADAGADQTIIVGESVTLQGSTTSSDPVSYQWSEGNKVLSNSQIYTTGDFEVGVHAITLSVRNDKDEAGTDEVIVTVNETPDETAPIITLLGDKTTTLIIGDTYTDAGATADDNRDGDITVNIITVNPVDTTTVGTYTVTYNVSDAAGNNADEVNRTVKIVDVTQIILNKDNIQLNLNKSTSIRVNAQLDDNTTVDITDKVEWIIGDDSIISVDKNIILGLQEGETSLSARYHNYISQRISVKVYMEVNGYKLPSKPDETLNNSTLLGVDSNNNGVRDDVERWIFLEMEIYNGYEKIEQVIAMQEAKAFQMTLKDPANIDDIVHKAMAASTNCWVWYSHSKNLPFQDRMLKFSRVIKDKCFNTKDRLKTYWQYDGTLAGRVFTSTPTLQTQSQCEVSIDGL